MHKAASLLVVALAVASISQAPEPTIELAPDEGSPGAQVVVTGFFPGWTGTVTALLGTQGGAVLGEGEILDRDGAINFPILIPNLRPGVYRVIACVYSDPTGECLSPQAEDNLTVVAPQTTTTTTTTATTVTTLPPTSTTLGLSATTTTFVDPPGTSVPANLAFTTTAVSLPTPGGVADPNVTHFPDVEITAVEVTQGIQDLQNRMPLIAHRRTLVRVYVAADRIDDSAGLGNISEEEPGETIGPEGWEPVDGALLLQRGGASKIVYADNAPIVAYRTGSDRNDAQGTLNFNIDDEWTTGEVKITAFVWSYLPETVVTSEPDAGNNYAIGTVFFQVPEKPLVIVLRLDANTGNVLSGASYESAVETVTTSYQLRHPLDEPNFAVLHQHLGPGPLPNPDAEYSETWNFAENASEPLARMRWLYYLWDLGNLDRIMGLIPTSLNTGNWSGLTDAGTKVAWSKPTINTPGHEAAHQYKIRHVECKDEDDDTVGDEVEGGGWQWIDQTHPSGLPNCSLAPIDPTGYYGVDLYDNVMAIHSNDPSHPNAAYPFMSYQGPRFVDPYHYCRLMAAYEVGCSPEAIGLTPKVPPSGPVNCGPSFGDQGIALDLCLWAGLDNPAAQLGPEGSMALAVPVAASEEWVLVETDLTTGEFGHAMIVADQPWLGADWADRIERVKAGLLGNEVMVRVTDAEGGLIAQMPFSGVLGGHFEGGPNPIPNSLELLPWPEGATTIDFLIDGEVVDSVSESQAPTVIIDPLEGEQPREFELSWTGTDPDGDGLIYAVLWSGDGGDSWQPVEVDLVGNSLTITDLHGLPGGEVLIQVLASDGLATGTATAGPFTVETGAPTVLISAPDTMTQYQATDLVVHANDPEDGILSEAVWTSNLDGELGSGKKVSARNLSVGVHTIGATVTDSDGNTATADTTVEVVAGELPVPRAPGAVPDAETLLQLGPDRLAEFPLPTTTSITAGQLEPETAGFPVGWVAVAAGLVVLVTGAYWIRRRR